jgi:ElaB/YqjD/DUF883 family membrane-anchored ribosome-binding protein
MGESGSRDAAAGLAAHSKDAESGLKATGQAESEHTLSEAADSAQEAFKALIKLVRERPLTALMFAGTFGWLIGRMGKYI